MSIPKLSPKREQTFAFIKFPAAWRRGSAPRASRECRSAAALRNSRAAEAPISRDPSALAGGVVCPRPRQGSGKGRETAARSRARAGEAALSHHRPPEPEQRPRRRRGARLYRRLISGPAGPPTGNGPPIGKQSGEEAAPPFRGPRQRPRSSNQGPPNDNRFPRRPFPAPLVPFVGYDAKLIYTTNTNMGARNNAGGPVGAPAPVARPRPGWVGETFCRGPPQAPGRAEGPGSAAAGPATERFRPTGRCPPISPPRFQRVRSTREPPHRRERGVKRGGQRGGEWGEAARREESDLLTRSWRVREEGAESNDRSGKPGSRQCSVAALKATKAARPPQGRKRTEPMSAWVGGRDLPPLRGYSARPPMHIDCAVLHFLRRVTRWFSPAESQ